MQSIVGYLEKWVTDTPDKMLYTFIDGTASILEWYTFRQFHERSNYVAANLKETGKVISGQPILLVYPPGLEMAVAFMACVKLGALPVLVPPPDTSGLLGGIEKLCRMTQDSGATVALTTQSYMQHFEFLTNRNAEASAYLQNAPLHTLDWLLTDPLQGHLPTFQSQPQSLLFLQYTSGSTQNPRGVMVSHANVIHNSQATLDHQPVGVSWLPHYHDMGLIGYYLFIMITGGSTVNFSTFNFLKRPFLWLETLSKVGATITSAPNFAYEYCLREDRVPTEKLASLNLSSMRCMMNASEPVRSTTYTRFLERFGPCGLSPQASVVFYGLAENTLSVTGRGRVQQVVNSHLIQQNHLRMEPPRPDGYNQQRLVSCGKPLPGVEVQIVDNVKGVALGEGQIGEVWLGGKSKAEGYWRNPALTQAVFQASISGDQTNRTYLRTGDAGFVHEGELFICGRLKDMIIIGGQNYYPADIETVVEGSAPQIRTGCVAAFGIEDAEKGEAIAVIAEAKRADDLPDLEAICREVQKRCQVDVALLAIVPHGTIAKTSSGKIARQECKARWASGEVSALASRQAGPKEEADSAIDHFLRHFPGGEYEDRTLSDLGIDSLTLVDISLQLDKIVKKQMRFRNSQTFQNLYDLRLLQSITVGELRTFHAQSQANGRSFRLASQPYVKRLRAIENEEAKSMQQDVDLPRDIIPPGGPVPENGKVLLTGSTGFLGSFLLASLLNRTDCEVVALVRAEDDVHASSRIKSAVQQTGLWNSTLRERFTSRTVALAGDIAQSHLGLSQESWEELAQECTSVYHCGAEVDYVKPYHRLQNSNVSGTVEALRLACQGPAKRFHFVSTTFIYGFTSRKILWESDPNPEMDGLNFGYPQSKWVAEQLVYGAAQRGLDARVYRPSLITASRLGRYVRRDIVARLFAYMIKYGVAMDSINQVSMLPVDVCADNIVALSLLTGDVPQTFHVTTTGYHTMQDACSVIHQKWGYPFEYISLEKFVTHVNTHCTPQDPLFPLVAFLNQNYKRILKMGNKRYDNQNYRQAQDRSSLSVPEPSLEETASQIVSFLKNENLIPKSPLPSELPQ